MKTIPFRFLVMLLFLSVLSGCIKEDDSELRELELRILNNYLETNNITVEPTSAGLYYIEEEAGTGFESPVAGDWVSIHYTIYLVDGEQIRSTTRSSVATENDIFIDNYLYGPTKVAIPTNIDGLNEGLRLMKEGGKVRLIFSSELGFGGNRFQGIPPYSSLIIDVELIEIIEDPVQDQLDKTSDYLEANDFPQDTTTSGLHFISIIEGSGDSASFGATATVDVTGRILGGGVFMDESDLDVQMEIINTGVTEGLQEGISYMKEGGVAKLIVPWDIGFGPGGFSNSTLTTKGPIPPYSYLVYDVELKEWK